MSAKTSGVRDLEDPTATTKLTKTGRISKALKGRRTHRCETCDKSYTRAEHLRRHQLNHQSKAYRCQFPGCGRDFHRQDLLHKHEVEHPSHFAQPRPPDQPGMPYGRLEVQTSVGNGVESPVAQQGPDGFRGHMSHDSADGYYLSPEQSDASGRFNPTFYRSKEDVVDSEVDTSSVTSQLSPAVQHSDTFKDLRHSHERELSDGRFKNSTEHSPTSQMSRLTPTSSYQPLVPSPSHPSDGPNPFIHSFPNQPRQEPRSVPDDYGREPMHNLSPQTSVSTRPPDFTFPGEPPTPEGPGPPPNHASTPSQPANIVPPQPLTSEDITLFQRFIESHRKQPCQSRRSVGTLKCLRHGCGGAFNDKTSWLWHIEQMVPRQLFKCPVCPEIFQRQEGLANHMRKHHPGCERPMIPYEVPFRGRCGFCGFESGNWERFWAGHVHEHFLGRLGVRGEWGQAYPPPMVPVVL